MTGIAPARRSVLMIAPQPFLSPRGTPLSVLHMIEALCAAGHEVHLATYPFGEPVAIPGLTVHRCLRPPGVRGVPPGFSWRKVLLDGLLALRVARLALGRRFDVVHAVEEAVFFCLPLARWRGLPFVYDADSDLGEQLAGERSGRRWLRRLVNRCEAAALRRSSLAITMSGILTERVRRLAPGLPVAQIEDRPPTIAGDPPEPARRDELRRALCLDGCRVVVYTGNLAAYQGVDLLVEALPGLVARVPEARLLLVGGETDQVRSLEATLAAGGLGDLVRCTGQQPPGRMAELMALGDAVVSPRRSGTNTPLKVYSYMASGVPIVATDVPGHRPPLDPEVAVLCAPTAGDLAAALAAVLRAPEAHRHLAVAARERARRDHAPEVFARRVLAAYERIPGGRKAATASSPPDRAP